MIYLLGPLPPPVHGFSVMNQMMHQQFLAWSQVVVFDSTTKRVPKCCPAGVWRGLHIGRLWLQFLLGMIAYPPKVLYVGLSGGWGQLIDLPFLLVARIRSVPIFVHHHSFSYLNQTKWHNRLVFKVLSNAHHIALCSTMQYKLCQCYGLAESQVSILSNLSVMELPRQKEKRQATGQPPVLGFLSNITLEKGIGLFFDTVRVLAKQGVPIHARIAGPVQPAIRSWFDHQLQDLPMVEYVGPVYGDKKNQFLGQLSLLLFPSLLMEAEPLTLHEAMLAGVPVIASSRGCIASMVPDGTGLVITPEEDFVAVASAFIADIAQGKISLDQLAMDLPDYSRALKAEADQQLKALLARIRFFVGS